MKVETLALITKGWCLISGAMAAAVAVGLSQIDNVPPEHIFSAKLWQLILGSYSVGCNALVAFLSQSFGDWKAQRGGTQFFPKPNP